jgi:hypothetical protein
MHQQCSFYGVCKCVYVRVMTHRIIMFFFYIRITYASQIIMFRLLYDQCKPGDSLEVVIFYNDISNMVADRVTLNIKDIIRDPDDVFIEEKKYVRRRFVLEQPITIGKKNIVVHHIDAFFRLVFEYDGGARYTETVKFKIDGLPDMSLLDMCMYAPEFDEKIAQLNKLSDEYQKACTPDGDVQPDVVYVCPECISAGIKEGCKHKLDKIPHWTGLDGKKLSKLI